LFHGRNAELFSLPRNFFQVFASIFVPRKGIPS
jgi:hypothetical protein